MNRNHRIWSFIKAKGFYIALALCITGAGTAAWLTAQNTISGIREQQQKPPAVTEQGEGNQWDYEDILQQQTGGEANTPSPLYPLLPLPHRRTPLPHSLPRPMPPSRPQNLSPRRRCASACRCRALRPSPPSAVESWSKTTP